MNGSEKNIDVSCIMTGCVGQVLLLKTRFKMGARKWISYYILDNLPLLKHKIPFYLGTEGHDHVAKPIPDWECMGRTGNFKLAACYG